MSFAKVTAARTEPRSPEKDGTAPGKTRDG
jgi:hypothetical protein